MFYALTQQDLTATAQQRLTALRRALEDAQDLYKFLSAYSASDLATTLGYTTTDAQDLLTAAADANELAVLYNGGALGTYTLPYDFSASQRVVIGP